MDRSKRVVEAYIGEYASGKSEIAINRALELNEAGRKVTLVDLDTVEPFYTLRPISKDLAEKGIDIISLSESDYFGLGETGAMLHPQARWALWREGDVILDVGYGVYGASTLNLVEGAVHSQELRVIAVVNATRPITNSRSRIVEYLRELQRVDGIVANTHLGDDTTAEIIINGNRDIFDAAEEMNIPIYFIAALAEHIPAIEAHYKAVPSKIINRFMPQALW